MAKAAKKKDQSLKGTQRRHNSATRGLNSWRRGPLWAIRQYEDGSYERIYVPWHAMWDWSKAYNIVEDDDTGRTVLIHKKRSTMDKYPEPYDALSLNWEVELREYAQEMKARVYREVLDNNAGYRYHVHNGVETLLIIQSNQNINFGPQNPRRKGSKK